jgi:hypothetical protein
MFNYYTCKYTRFLFSLKQRAFITKQAQMRNDWTRFLFTLCWYFSNSNLKHYTPTMKSEVCVLPLVTPLMGMSRGDIRD